MLQNQNDEQIGKTALIDHLDWFICPACQGPLRFLHADLFCSTCNQSFGFENGIPCLFWPTSNEKDVSLVIKEFYEKNPFPSYDALDTADRLVELSRKGIFARLLDNQIPRNWLVLEVGCGTGQLSNFLGIAGRTVFGTDICLNSLNLGQRFKVRNKLKTVSFIQMNLFKPVFSKRLFDIIICSGVLHHTSDPFAGFVSISELLKPGGFIVVGLYNKFGRVWTDVRRSIFKFSKNQLQFLDPYLRRGDISPAKKRIWFADQYLNPHESKHSFDEVLGWFDKTDFEFINSIPKITQFAAFSQHESLFRENERGTSLDHLIVQLRLALSGGREGGFFIMIGRKKPTNS
jgi:SAM-dependent methyltransferase